jgi:outer membrane protein TolC
MLKHRAYWGRPLLVAALWVSAQAPLAWANAVPLSELEAWAQSEAPAVRLAQAEKDAAAHRTDNVRASQGARLFGGASLGNAREAVTDTTSRSYQRAQAQVGVRWPLLGSREAQLRSVREAEQTATARQLRLLQTQSDAVQAVRRAYVRHLRSAQRIALTQAFLATRPAVQDVLQRRTQSGWMLDAERFGLLATFDTVENTQRAQHAAQEAARRELSRLTGRALPTLVTQPLAWPESCQRPDILLAQADDHPAVRLARLEVESADQIAGHLRREGIEAGVSVAQGVSKDLGGAAGHNTSVGIDISVPLGWRAQRDAVLGQIQSERHRAESLLELRRSESQAGVEQALSQWQLRQAETAASTKQLDAAKEVLRVATLRQARLDDGDGFARMFNARYALLQAGLQTIDATERAELATVELAAWAHSGCDHSPASGPDAVSTALVPVLQALAAVPPTSSPSTPSSSPTPAANPGQGSALRTLSMSTSLSKPRSASTSTYLAWYVWNGQALLQAPHELRKLPPGSERLLLSFTAPQLQALTQPQGSQQLARLVAKARLLGLQIELLLGEPLWVLPSHRQDLLDLLGRVRHLPFSALHLDLERSQLPEQDQPQWDQGVLDTLSAAKGVVAWPIALTTHYRDLESADFVHQLYAAGASELTAMVYVSNPQRAADIARPLLQGPAGLQWSIAQSVERTLPPQESSHSVGQAAALQRWHSLAQSLSGTPGFRGIAVQSWEEFKEARP